MDFDYGPTPHLHRKFSDYWAVKKSGAEVQDETTCLSVVNAHDYIGVNVRHDEEDIQLRARYVIGADGALSAVRKSIYPSYEKTIPWFVVGQKLHQIIENPLDDEYFHFWFHPELGNYTWSHIRDGKLIVGTGCEKGDNLAKRQQNVVHYLEQKHGVKLGAGSKLEGTVENFGPSLINRYVFGKGNVLITGQAAGFFNMIAEGMSVALHSGAIAGESVVQAFQSNKPVQDIYRTKIGSEVRHCSDQWNPLQIAFGRPHEADFRKTLIARHTLGNRLRIIGEILTFTKIYGKFKWGRQIISQALYRMLHGEYNRKRWH
jgi:flavin-dependent dehydrogenase